MTVQVAFEYQAAICTTAGAPFTGRLCRLAAERLSADTAIGARLLSWAGNPSHEGDAVPLRLMGGLHALARSQRRAEWSAVYPPATAPDDETLWTLMHTMLAEEGAWLSPWLDGPPQTNEVGRSGPLMAGLLVLAERFGLPFSLYELGASAGLNSLLDRYGYELGGLRAGEAASGVQLKPRWTGRPPPKGEVREVRVVSRQGVDRHPLDVSDPATRQRLSAYVWADQAERLQRLDAALDIAQEAAKRTGFAVEQGDAADWLEQALSVEPQDGVCRVVMHTIAYQYFPATVQARIRSHLETVGARAAAAAPLAWLRLEAHDQGGFERRPALELTVWPDGQTHKLAVAQPHGAEIDWLYTG